MVVGEDGVYGRQVCPLRVLKDARLIQTASRAEVDVLARCEDALVGPRDGQVGAGDIVVDVVGTVVAEHAVGDHGPRRGDAAADGDVTQDAEAEGGEAELARLALDGDAAAQAAVDADVAEGVAQRDYLPVEAPGRDHD